MIFNILPEFAVAAILLAVGWFVGNHIYHVITQDKPPEWSIRPGDSIEE